MEYKFIEVNKQGPVGWYRFNRPPINAVDWEMLDELTPALNGLLEESEVKVIVLASAIERYFSTGADVSSFRAQSGRMPEWVEKTHELARAIRGAKKPILAAINGVAVGGGLEMTFHADLRFAASDARLGQPEVQIGFIPPVAGTQGLVRLVGRSHAFKMLYSGEPVDAENALSMGLVDFVSSPEKLVDDVQAYAEMLATKPANALSAIRRCLIDGGSRAFDDGLEVERAEAVSLAKHANFDEGVCAFLEKRTPNWV